MDQENLQMTVLGAGAMGAGIAQVAAMAGMPTRLFDIERSAAEAGLSRIEAMLDKGVQRGKVSEQDRADCLDRLQPCWELAPALQEAACVIEAAPERFDLKYQLFQKVGEQVSVECMVATNTSSISIDRLAGALPHPERFLGLHFFNPPPLMALLEVVQGAQTSPAVVEQAMRMARQMGKEPILVKDSPGFASSRLGVAIGLEAIRMLEEGVASAADIDKAMELGYRFPMGPLKLTDLIGIDVRLDIATYLDQNIPGGRFQVPQLMRDMVEMGHFGQKSGEGFYHWDGLVASPK